ncbi:MAG TPA: ATP-binding protein [Casimicrobiaceae bacterium]|nr:ATP-binding protein [Casimicrobiaceae bacterium]
MPAAREHFVQFYEHDDSLVASIAEFVGTGFASDTAAVVVATPDHLRALEQRLGTRGIDVAAARAAGRLVALDAQRTLESMLVEGWPDAARFTAVIEPCIAMAQKRAPRVLAFGEMVALLWRDGRHDAAVHLEALWNDLARRYDFSLFCAYPIAQMGSGSWEAVHAVCAAHSHAMPANAVVHASEEKRLAEICDLKRRGRALDAEVGERRAAEQRLARSNRELADLRDRTLQAIRALRASEARAGQMRALLVARGVSQHKQMDVQPRDVDDRKDEFIAMLAHELRNPLAPIRNAAAVLRRMNANDAAAVELCRMLERQVQQMTRLIDDLLDVGRITRGLVHFRRERVDLADVVMRAVEASAPLLSRRRHRLNVDVPNESLQFDGDRVRLTQMIVNLLDNAAKHTPDGGAIALRVISLPGRIELRVQDSGIGIPPEMLPKIFGLFVQAPRPGTDVQEGLGIGLALVRMIAEHHGGSVRASSAGAGKGSVFVVRLPVLSEARRHHPSG